MNINIIITKQTIMNDIVFDMYIHLFLCDSAAIIPILIKIHDTPATRKPIATQGTHSKYISISSVIIIFVFAESML